MIIVWNVGYSDKCYTPKLTQDVAEKVEAEMHRNFEDERDMWADERQGLEQMYWEKDVVHQGQLATTAVQLAEYKKKCRELQTEVQHLRDIEKIAAKERNEDRRARVHKISKIVTLSKMTEDEEKVPFMELPSPERRDELRALADMVVSGKESQDTRMKVLEMIGGETPKKPKKDAAGMVQGGDVGITATDHDRQWQVFGELRELDQTVVDIICRNKTVLDPEPLIFHPEFEFERLYDRYAHNFDDGFRIEHPLTVLEESATVVLDLPQVEEDVDPA